MSRNGTRVTLITGGCGFVGRALVNAFAERGDDVIAVDVTADPFRDDVRFVEADIRDEKQMTALCEGVDSVIHNASLVHTRQTQKETLWSVNFGGTKKLLDACHAQDVPKFVYVSTASAVYEGRDIENGDESLPYSSVSQAPYADSKIAAEKHVLSQNGVAGTATCAIRPHVVFGPGDGRFLPAILEKARAGRLKWGVGRGDKLSDFTYVDNLVDAIVAAEERLGPDSKVAGEAYFVTNGEPVEFFWFVDQVLIGLGLDPIRGRIPFFVAYPVAAVAEAVDALRGGRLGAENGMSRFAIRYMCTHHYFSIEKARRDLGYDPAVSLREGIRRTVEHLSGPVARASDSLASSVA